MRNPAENSRGFGGFQSWRLALASSAMIALSAMALPAAAFAPTVNLAQADKTQSESPDADNTAPVQKAFEGPAAPAAPSDAPKNPLTGMPAKPAQNSAPQAGTDKTDPAAVIDAPAGEIIRDMSKLPAPVRQMREKIIEAAASGDIERLRPLVNIGPNQTLVMNADSDDPVEMLKSFAGDADGQEILAIFLDLLTTAAVRLQAGKPDEIYVWPYFAGKPLSTLTPPERVELLRIVTAGDMLGMQESDTYNFYRLGISPDGQWKFVAGGE